jgi:hypothetical protein
MSQPRCLTHAFGALFLLSAACSGAAKSDGSGGASSSSSSQRSSSGTTTHASSSSTSAASSSTGGPTAIITAKDISATGVGSESETSVAATPNGIVAATWINVGTKPSIGYAFSTDGGKTWLPPAVASPNDTLKYADPTVVVGSDGSFYVSFVGYDDAFSMGNVMLAHASPGATTFDAPVLVSPAGNMGPFDKPYIAITKSQAVLVSYTDFSSASIVVARSTDAKTFTRTVGVQADAGTLAMPCPDPDGGRVWLTYHGLGHIGLTWSDDDGLSFPAANISTPSAPGDSTALSSESPACIGKGNDVWVVYGLSNDTVDPSKFDPKDYSLRLAHSSDKGMTFAMPVDAGDATAAMYLMEPSLVLEPGGAIDLAYYAGNADKDPMASWRSARSTDHGQSFGPSEVLEKPLILDVQLATSTWIGDYAGLAYAGGRLYSTYVDNASGTSHISFWSNAVP